LAGDLVPSGIEKVILRLANPQEYRGDMNTTQAVLDHLNGVLKLEGLEVALDGIRPRLRQVQAAATPPKPKGRAHEPAPDFVRIIGEPRLGAILSDRWEEAQKCMDAGAHLSGIVMMGSVLEGVLLAKSETDLALVNQSAAAPKDKTGKPKPLHDWSLSALIEPCAMCAGAIVQARVERLVYGADDPKGGAVRSCFAVLYDPRLKHRVEVTPGILAEECAALLQAFFAARR
jgi:hypothetical protein